MGKHREFTLIESEKFKLEQYICEARHRDAIDATIRLWEKKGWKPKELQLIEHAAYKKLKTHAEDLYHSIDDIIEGMAYTAPELMPMRFEQLREALAEYHKAFPKGEHDE